MGAALHNHIYYSIPYFIIQGTILIQFQKGGARNDPDADKRENV